MVGGIPKGWRLRLIAEQAFTISIHDHPLPRTKLNSYDMRVKTAAAASGADADAASGAAADRGKPKETTADDEGQASVEPRAAAKHNVGELVYQYDGSGAFVCRVCMGLQYGVAHHCCECVPAYDVCVECFQQQKALDIGRQTNAPGSKGVSLKDNLQANQEEFKDSSDDDDPFRVFQAKPARPTSTTFLEKARHHDFRQLLEVLFPKQRQDLAAEAQGVQVLKVDYSLADERTGRTMLHCASEAGNDKVVLGLLMHVSDTVKNGQDHQGLTPLMIASMNGNSAVVEELLYGSADTRLKCNNGYTALMLSVCYGWADITSRLLFSGAAVNEVVASTGRTSLSIAALNGSTACVKRLLQCDDVDRSLMDNEGYTPILLAAAMGYQDIIELFSEEDRRQLHW
eukprot:Rhum_TRINITY_DN11311_c0_g1::Rhum_TRINITY_DN11311_c0_g1_i1::g.43818::m.43818